MLRVEYAIEKPSNKLLAVTGLESDNWVGGNLSKSGWEARLLSPFPLSSAVEARGRRLSGRLPRVALAPPPPPGSGAASRLPGATF